MSSPASAPGSLATSAGRSAIHRIALLLVFLAVASSGIVFSEPAPFDVLMLALLVLLPIAGLSRPRVPHWLALGLLLLVAVGGIAASSFAVDVPRATTHTVITFFLSIAAFVIASFVALRPETHARLVMRAYLAAAAVATVAGLVGYFDLVPALTELFTNYGRARGTFKDPNVYGAFIAPAIIFAGHIWLQRPGKASMPALLLAALLTVGVLVSFSRGAWVNAGVAMATFGYLSFVTAASNRSRLKHLGVGCLGAIALAAVVMAALQFEAVATLMDERAALTQSYDEGPEGRFGGQEKARELIVGSPLGIGALEFGARHHHEDVHNVYLSMFLNAGWLGGGIYALLVLATILLALRAVRRRAPCQGLLVAASAAFLGTVVEGLVIDTDHWRHFFVLLGLVWGLSVPSRPAARQHLWQAIAEMPDAIASVVDRTRRPSLLIPGWRYAGKPRRQAKVMIRIAPRTRPEPQRRRPPAALLAATGRRVREHRPPRQLTARGARAGFGRRGS